MTRWLTETIGDCVLYRGDCLEILPTLGKVDAVVTDPPYGINAARDRKSQKWGWKDYPAAGWDKARPTSETILACVKAGRHVVIWGGNYFTDCFPPSGRWLVWDKCQTDFSLADCELAWCSFNGAVRRISYPRAKAVLDGKEHPTQKPLLVMMWSIEQLPEPSNSILDPFMGSGTTGVACVKLERKFIGIEIEPKYFDIACRRIEAAHKEPRLPLPDPKAKQEAMQL